jgi:hypothetical protein
MSRLEEDKNSAWIEIRAVWRGNDGPVLNENRRIRLEWISPTLWRIDIESELSCAKGPIALGQTAFGFLGVRMAKTIGVIDGGGRILNSEGGLNEAGCFRKPARWMDYSGPVTATLDEGITLFDHPQNLNHPVEFHVRNDGWMGAATTFRNAYTIEPGTPLRLKHGLLVHSADATPATYQAEWERFAQTPFQPFDTKKR